MNMVIDDQKEFSCSDIRLCLKTGETWSSWTRRLRSSRLYWLHWLNWCNRLGCWLCCWLTCCLSRLGWLSWLSWLSSGLSWTTWFLFSWLLLGWLLINMSMWGRHRMVIGYCGRYYSRSIRIVGWWSIWWAITRWWSCSLIWLGLLLFRFIGFVTRCLRIVFTEAIPKLIPRVKKAFMNWLWWHFEGLSRAEDSS